MEDEHAQRLADGQRCLEAALAALKRGWSIIPLCPRDHYALGRSFKKHSQECKDDNRGKSPYLPWKQYQTVLATEHDVRQWWIEVPTSNLGLVLGPLTGLVRIDLDGALAHQALLELSGGDLPPTLEFISGRSDGTGRGLLYKYPAGAVFQTTHKPLQVKQEIRLQALGAQTVIPPSRHAHGGYYCWVGGHSPDEIEAALTPDWLRTLLEVKINGHCHSTNGNFRSNEEWQEIFAGVPEGRRDEDASAVIGSLLSALSDITSQSALRTAWGLVQAWNGHNDPPLSEEQLQKVWRSIYSKEKAAREKADLSNLDRLIGEKIEQSKEDARNGEARPSWHLVKIESKPPEYLLRSHYWETASALTDGYLPLTPEQLLNWSAIYKAVFCQTGVIIPAKYKNWSSPDGMLSRLMSTCEVRQAQPEAKRDLYILAFVYRWLATASPLEEEGLDQKSINTKRPHLLSDGRRVFKLDTLKARVKDAREDFTHKQIMAILDDYGFTPCTFQYTRWWSIESARFSEAAHLTKEAVSQALSTPESVAH